MPPPGIDIPDRPALSPAPASLSVPDYLEQHYWWAYVRPAAVRFFERPWLVNLILLGNYRRLEQAALNALGPTISGKLLQVACVYGGLTADICRRLAPDARLDVVDILPVQLSNLGHKLGRQDQLRLMQADSADLPLEDASYDQVLLFFLLHEQPAEVRRRTLSEALRVLKPGGRLVIVDYSHPARWNPVRWLLLPWLGRLEPFARDLWRDGVRAQLPQTAQGLQIESRQMFGGLYEIVTLN